MKVDRIVRVATVLAVGALCPLVQASNQSVAATGNIQGAIDACASSGGGTVSIGSGTGTISTTLKIKSSVALVGAGNPATTLNAGSDITVVGTASEGLRTSSLKNLKLNGRGKTGSTNCWGVAWAALSSANSGMTISGVQSCNFGGMGVHVKRCNSSSCSSDNFHDNGADLFAHNLYIRECTSTNVSGSQLNNTAIGSGFHLAGATSGGSIKTTTANGNGQDGQNIQDSPSNYTIDGCTANNNRNATAGRSDGIGINAQAGSGTISNNHASGNRVNYQLGSGYTKSNNT